MAGPYSYDVKAAAAYLGINPRRLYVLAARCEIEHLRDGGTRVTRMVHGESCAMPKFGRLRFSKDGLDAWIEAQRVPVLAKPYAALARPDEPRPALVMPAIRRFSS